MSRCDKHGYNNGTFCPACDLETIAKGATTTPSSLPGPAVRNVSVEIPRCGGACDHYDALFTADQMRAYGADCVTMAREEAYGSGYTAGINDARAALASPDTAGWRPIESAPREERILLWDGKWASPGANCEYDYIGWLMDCYGHEEYPEPTHWMPLPAQR